MVCPGDAPYESYCSDPVLKGSPEMIFRANNVQEVRDILLYCNREKLPVTFCGSQTSLTGSSVAENGLLMSTEKMDRILDISDKGKRPTATVEPGILLADFQDRLMREFGLFYPPDPTSRKEARLGGTVATNATGEDSFLYGSTRCHVRALKMLFPDGSEKHFERSDGFRAPLEKNRAGYFLHGDPLDWFIGSEGTLGFITEITVDLEKNPPGYFSLIVFFPSLASALTFVAQARRNSCVSPRCLELLDHRCLDIIRNHPASFSIPPEADTAIYLKQNFFNDSEKHSYLSSWLEQIKTILRESDSIHLLDDTVMAEDESKKDVLRDLRHFVPASINEKANVLRRNGGGKIGTDWWVPSDFIQKALDLALAESRASGIPCYLFGHIGNGHPHLEYLVSSNKEKEVVEQIILKQCNRAVSWGGGVAGEHGLGKIKKHLLPIQHSANIIRRMTKIKQQFDPHWVLGRNNIFAPP